MRSLWAPVVLLALCSQLEVAAAETAPASDTTTVPAQPRASAQGGTGPGAGAEAVDASSVFLPCTPVSAYWVGPPQSEGMPPGPELAIVDIDVRPKDARLYLDDRFVGRARYLDGRPGYLYLAPGRYDLELRLDGYRTVAIELDAEAGCRFDLKHRLERVKGEAKEKKEGSYGKGRPFNRVFAPLHPTDEPGAAMSRSGGPDPKLRPDIDRSEAGSQDRAPAGAALEIRLTPRAASVEIDGVFAATGEELSKMEGPLAVASGSHRIEVSAAGYRTYSKTVEVEDGQVVELSIELTPETNDVR